MAGLSAILKELYSDKMGDLVYHGSPFFGTERGGASMSKMMDHLRRAVDRSKLSENLTRRLETKATPEGLLGEIGAKVVMDLEAAAK